MKPYGSPGQVLVQWALAARGQTGSLNVWCSAAPMMDKCKKTSFT